MFVAIGFVAQLCDGALGMGFGAISSTVNGAKILTGTASTVSHLACKKVQWRALAYLSIGGVLGGLIGALLAAPLAARLTARVSKRRLTIGVGVMVVFGSALRLLRDSGLLRDRALSSGAQWRQYEDCNYWSISGNRL